MCEIVVGKNYLINHSRKGIFKLWVSEIDAEWITGTILEGTAEALCDYNERGPGEEVTIRISLCNSITEVPR